MRPIRALAKSDCALQGLRGTLAALMYAGAHPKQPDLFGSTVCRCTMRSRRRRFRCWKSTSSTSPRACPGVPTSSSRPRKRASLFGADPSFHGAPYLARQLYRQHASMFRQHSARSPQQSLAAKARADTDISSTPMESLVNVDFMVFSNKNKNGGSEGNTGSVGRIPYFGNRTGM